MENSNKPAATSNVVSTLGGVGSLPPLNPNDLAVSNAPKKVAVDTSKPVSVGEVYDELKQKVRESIMHSSVAKILYVMRATNITIAVFMLMIALYEMFTMSDFWSAVSEIFSVAYTILFAIILISYEARNDKFDEYLRESFGFMYSPKGRCIFLCFISIFPFSMGPYGILVSCLGFANAYFNYFVITKHPSFTRGIPDYEPPLPSKDSSQNSTEGKQDTWA